MYFVHIPHTQNLLSFCVESGQVILFQYTHEKVFWYFRFIVSSLFSNTSSDKNLYGIHIQVTVKNEFVMLSTWSNPMLACDINEPTVIGWGQMSSECDPVRDVDRSN